MLNDLLQTKAKAEEIAKKIQAIFPRQKDNRSSKNDSENEKQELEAQKYKYSTKPNNMYAIYGGWGTGKTRLLEELEDIIITDYRVVWFRPWEYFEESQNIDNKLLSEILEQDKIWKWLNLGGIIFIIMTIFTIGNMQWFQANLWQNFIALNLNDYFVVIGVFVIILLILYKFNIIQFISNLGIGSISFDIAKLYSNLRDYTESSKDIQEKISSKVNTKTIVFVDDLDRCRKETVVEVLEHIKHFYASDKLFFIFAIDRKSLATYIAEHYNYQKDSGEIDIDRGYQYLDKLFPEYYNLRYLDGRELFNEYLKKQEIYNELTDTDRENYYLLIEYYASFNWRKVGALIDKFAEIYKKMNAKVVLYDDNSNVLYLDQIFRWCLVHEFYPEIFEERNWREAIIKKFYKNNELNRNLFREQVFIGGNSNQYLTPITEERNETFHLEKLYNYAGEFEQFDEKIIYLVKNPDQTGSGWKILDEPEKSTKIILNRNIDLPWSADILNGESKIEIRDKVIEFLDTLIGMKPLQMEELDFMKKDISGVGTVKIAKMKA